MTTVMAFSKALRVMMSRGRDALRLQHIHDGGAGAAAIVLLVFATMAFCAELLGKLMPSASMALAMVLAVYMPPQEPAPGMAHCSTSMSSLSSILPAACLPTASKTETMSSLRSFYRP